MARKMATFARTLDTSVVLTIDILGTIQRKSLLCTTHIDTTTYFDDFMANSKEFDTPH